MLFFSFILLDVQILTNIIWLLQPQMPEGPGFRGPPGPMGGPSQMGANPYAMPK